MTGDRTTHVTVTYERDRVEISHVYAVNEDALHDAQLWAIEQKNPTGQAFERWLEEKGCQLDSSDGPAVVWRYANGGTEQTYYRDGKQHREDGPAYVLRHADGSMVELYYRDGKLHREDGPAGIWRNADGSTTLEHYYHDGKLVKEEKLYMLYLIPGVTVQRPAPKAPNRPGAPGPT
jgi:hypothetical protein